MKISSSYLKQIIKEEISKVVEAYPQGKKVIGRDRKGEPLRLGDIVVVDRPQDSDVRYGRVDQPPIGGEGPFKGEILINFHFIPTDKMNDDAIPPQKVVVNPQYLTKLPDDVNKAKLLKHLIARQEKNRIEHGHEDDFERQFKRVEDGSEF